MINFGRCAQPRVRAVLFRRPVTALSDSSFEVGEDFSTRTSSPVVTGQGSKKPRRERPGANRRMLAPPDYHVTRYGGAMNFRRVAGDAGTRCIVHLHNSSAAYIAGRGELSGVANAIGHSDDRASVSANDGPGRSGEGSRERALDPKGVMGCWRTIWVLDSAGRGQSS
jgi:hypothetical protein